jgi:hypothetical protein
VVVAAHELSGCPLPPSSQSVTLTLTALGSFPLSSSCGAERCDVASVPLRGSGRSLGFPPETTAVDARALLGEEPFAGYAERRDSELDVLLWPTESSCPVYVATDGYPGDGGGHALGYAPEHDLVLMVGEDAEDARAQGAITVSMATGEVTLQPASQSPPAPVAFATLTSFDRGFLLAGGENPTRNADETKRERFDRAYVFDAETRVFESEPIALNWDRSHHAAVALSNGATLLIGGTAEGGLVRQLEAVFPSNSRSSILGLAALATGRLDPTALLLDDGRLFVGGGRASNGAPIGDVEWFDADGHEALEQRALPALPNRAFIGMPRGGVLSVPGCDTDGACESWEASWIDPEHAVELIPIPVTTRCPVPERPLLAPAGEGTPLLIARYRNGTACSWRFDPWPGDYRRTTDALAHARFVPEPLILDPPPNPLVSPLAVGAQTFFWVSGLTPGGIGALSVGNRGAWSRDLLSLVARDPEAPSRPLRLVPDRPVEPPDLELGERPLYAIGALSLRDADAATTFWVPDTRYDDVTVTLDLAPAAGDTTSPPGLPIVLFGGSELGGPAAPWPAAPDTEGAGASARVTIARRGASATLTSGGRTARYTIETGAVALGLRPGSAPAVLESLTVERR